MKQSNSDQNTFVYETFSCIARRYELFNALSSCGLYKFWLKKLVQTCPCSSEMRVLDLAAGTGDVSFALARTSMPREIYCTDLVPSMLDIAQKKYRVRSFGNTKFVFDLVDAQAIPYESESFDLVVIAYGIRNIPNREKALQEIFRVLKPGGSFVCLEFSHPQNPLMKCGYDWYSAYILPLWGRLIFGSDASVHYLVQSIKDFPHQRRLAKLITNAGFKEVTWENLCGGIVAIHRALKAAY